MSINHNYTDAYNNLGNALRDFGSLEDALTHYRKAQALSPDDTKTNYNVGTILFGLGRGEEAIEIFKTIKTPRGIVQSQACILECSFALGEYDRFFETQKKSSRAYKDNIRTAAINAFASQRLDRPNPHPFCKNPLGFVRMRDAMNDSDQDKGFLDTVISHLKSSDAIWEPPGKATKCGFQTRPTLFDEPNEELAQLEQTIKDEIEKYYSEFVAEDCGFINSFPTKRKLTGWFVRLVKGGPGTTEHSPQLR